MSEDYVQNYMKAVNNPLPQLKKTYDEELKLLRKFSDDTSVVLDVGCGAGRPADTYAKYVKKLVCIDNDEKMLTIAKERCNALSNVEYVEGDALNMKFADETFDLVYATYNLVGSVKKHERQELIDEMKRVAKVGSRVVSLTWKDDRVTTEFLKEYYPSIGLDILEADATKTVTSKGTFERISRRELLKYYKEASIGGIEFVDIGPVWMATVGTK